MTKTIVIDKLSDVSKLADLPEQMKQRALEAIEGQAMLMVYYAQEMCPVRTGALRSTIRMETSGYNVSVKVGGFGVNYASVVEERQPFMLPAWLMIQASLRETIESYVDTVLP